MTFLADVNVLVDLAVNREPWATDAKRLSDEAAARGVSVVVAAATLPTIFYVVRKFSDESTAMTAIDRTLAGADIVEVNRSTLVAARLMPGRDFEDNIQSPAPFRSAPVSLSHATRPTSRTPPVRVMSPAELLAALTAAEPHP